MEELRRKELPAVERFQNHWRCGSVEMTVYPYQDMRSAPLLPSQQLRAAHPDLYELLTKSKHASSLHYANIDIDPKGTAARERIQEGATPGAATFKLMSDLRSALTLYAQEIKEHPTSEAATVDYLVGISRIAGILERLGFESYSFDESINESAPQRLAERSYVEAGTETSRASALSRKHPLAIAVLTKEKLLERFLNPRPEM